MLRDRIYPYRIKSVSYIEWDPNRIYYPGKSQWWSPGKVLLCKIVTNKQRWRLIGAIDYIGFVYDSRIIGCFPKENSWPAEVLLCIYSSSYANAWYATHNKNNDVITSILSNLPIPKLSDHQIDHLTVIGIALHNCMIEISNKESNVNAPIAQYLINILLRTIDLSVANAIGLNAKAINEIDEFLFQTGKARPGTDLITFSTMISLLFLQLICLQIFIF